MLVEVEVCRLHCKVEKAEVAQSDRRTGCYAGLINESVVRLLELANDVAEANSIRLLP